MCGRTNVCPGFSPLGVHKHSAAALPRDKKMALHLGLRQRSPSLSPKQPTLRRAGANFCLSLAPPRGRNSPELASSFCLRFQEPAAAVGQFSSVLLLAKVEMFVAVSELDWPLRVSSIRTTITDLTLPPFHTTTTNYFVGQIGLIIFRECLDNVNLHRERQKGFRFASEKDKRGWRAVLHEFYAGRSQSCVVEETKERYQHLWIYDWEFGRTRAKCE